MQAQTPRQTNSRYPLLLFSHCTRCDWQNKAFGDVIDRMLQGLTAGNTVQPRSSGSPVISRAIVRIEKPF